MKNSKPEKINDAFTAAHIAPCGMNCRVCYAYLRSKNKCAGCRIDGFKPGYCTRCVIVHCDFLKDTASGFCFDCEKYPCLRMKQLDKRYRLKYKTSLMGNLGSIKSTGMDAFLQSESLKWRCPDCGDVVCIHNGNCVSCIK
jgi:hypothetical protein